MSYIPATDFLGLLRQTSGGVRSVRMPGLDFIVSGLARAGIFQVWVAQVAPTSNQATTVWFIPNYPQSWAAEGRVFLWNAVTAAYEAATPALWVALFSAASSYGYVFQSVAVGAAAVGAGTSLLAIQRAAPAATALALPSVAARNGKPLQIVDWSSGVVNHQITLTPAGGQTVMRAAAWDMWSTAVQLQGATLYPSIDLNGWVIAP